MRHGAECQAKNPSGEFVFAKPRGSVQAAREAAREAMAAREAEELLEPKKIKKRPRSPKEAPPLKAVAATAVPVPVAAADARVEAAAAEAKVEAEAVERALILSRRGVVEVRFFPPAAARRRPYSVARPIQPPCDSHSGRCAAPEARAARRARTARRRWAACVLSAASSAPRGASLASATAARRANRIEPCL
jgi:hypothetical protein